MTFEEWYESLSWRTDTQTVLDMQIAWDAGRAEGYAAAKEQAAGKVEEFAGVFNHEGFKGVAIVIRAMEPEP